MQFEKPYMLWYIFLLLIPIIFVIVKQVKIKKTTSFFYKTVQSSNRATKNLQIRNYIRIICYSVAYICVIFAIANPFWGTKTFPLQKVGSSVALVFDVSYSMNAKDSADGATRLENAKIYAKNLILNKTEVDQIPTISVVATKGTGQILVPSTEDHNFVTTVIDLISPKLISSEGTNLADGIMCAVNTFPENQARMQTIILFTDADETLGSIDKAIVDCVKRGINLFIVGFGSKDGIDVFTGDGETKIHTALMEDKMQSVVDGIKSKFATKNVKLEYFACSSAEGQIEIFQTIYPTLTKIDGNNQQVGYVTKNVSHHNLFLVIAIVFFVFGFVISKYKINIFSMFSACIILFLTSCSGIDFEQSFSVLKGSYFWQQGDYQKAEVEFMRTLNAAETQNNKTLGYYAVYNLGASYAMQNEEIASFQRFHSIDKYAPIEVQFNANYNLGVLFYSQGNYAQAKKYFKKALKIDNTSIKAKINYELAVNQDKNTAQEKTRGENTKNEEQVNSVLKDSIFSIIRENDQNLWKNQQTPQKAQTSLDY